MYNKIFTRILFSSIWTETYSTRIVWVTFLAAMDEDGVVHLATPKNVAALAQVTVEEADAAIAILEGPDPLSSNSEHDGRRIERIPGGWIVLNAKLYRDMAKRDQIRQLTAERVRRHRASQQPESTHAVTGGNAPVTQPKRSANGSVTASEAGSEAGSEKNFRPSEADDRGFSSFWSVYPRKDKKPDAMKAWRALRPNAALLETILANVHQRIASVEWQSDGGKYIPLPASYVRQRRWEDTGVSLPQTTGSTADAERVRTVAVLKDRERLLDGPRSDER